MRTRNYQEKEEEKVSQATKASINFLLGAPISITQIKQTMTTTHKLQGDKYIYVYTHTYIYIMFLKVTQ